MRRHYRETMTLGMIGMIALATCCVVAGAGVGCSALLGEGFSGGEDAATPASSSDAAANDAVVTTDGAGGDSTAAAVTRKCEDTPDCSVFVAQTESPTELILVNETLFWVRAGAKGLVVEYNFEADAGVPTPKDTGTPSSGVHDLTFSVYFPYAISPPLGGVHRYGIESSCATSVTTPLHLTTLTNGALVAADATGIHRIACGNPTTKLSDEPAGVKTLARGPGTGNELWWTRPSGAIVSCDGSTTLAACTSSQKTLATSNASDVDLLAVDDVRVFWSGEIDNATIRTKLKSAAAEAPPTVIATGQSVPKVLAPGGNVLYWTNIEGGTLMRAPSAGGTEPTVILTGLNRPWGLVVTSKEIFVAESGAGRILRVKRGTF